MSGSYSLFVIALAGGIPAVAIYVAARLGRRRAKKRAEDMREMEKEAFE